MDKILHQPVRKKAMITPIGVLIILVIITVITPGCGNKPSSPTPDPAEAYNKIGLEYYTNGDLDNAISNFDQAIQLNPSYAEAYSNRGSAFFSKDNQAQAISDFDQAIQLNPDSAAGAL